MADFCRDCSIQNFGEDHRDLAGLCTRPDLAKAICEGCGQVLVDSEGVVVYGPVKTLPSTK